MPHPILYLGDTSLSSAACYLAGVMHRAGLAFDYRASHEPSDAYAFAGRKLVILSDYPAARLDDKAHYALAMAIRSGTNLLVLGGWESYHGMGGDWDATSIAPLLPVAVSKADDRVNGDGVSLLRTTAGGGAHDILRGLPFDARPPVVGGWSRFSAKAGAQTLLEVVPHQVARSGDGFALTPGVPEPMLVVGTCEDARIACLATDAAPHWVGPFVDWGTDNATPSGAGRVQAQAPGAEGIEVGVLYARFFEQLVRWTGRM